ncbi:MAG: polysaccharide biosynthesis/export family protein [Acidobacteria bacterium]|nr:polysaccharide biosynthesis/export family protein [Acidobacteriota bacterium]
MPMAARHTLQFVLVVVTACLVGGLVSTAAAQTAAPPPTAGSQPAAVVPDSFVIGPEDVLGVVFWREPDLSGDVTVRPDGRISLPVIGELEAAGLTPNVLRERVQTAAAKYLTEVNVAVVVRQINSRKIFVTGEVATPGTYPLTAPRTVMQAIALAGGLTEFADAKNITVLRTQGGRAQSFKFNYRDVSKGKGLEQNIQLEPGDTVVVP